MTSIKPLAESQTKILNEQFSIAQNNWDEADHLVLGQSQAINLFKTIAIGPATQATEFEIGEQLDINRWVFNDDVLTGRAITTDQFLNRRLFNDALMVVHHRKVVHESYRNNLNADDRHVIHSCTKSLCSMLLAQAVDKGLVTKEENVNKYVTELAQHSAWHGVTVQHLWDMTTGIKYSEDYADPEADYWSYARAVGYYPTLDGSDAIGAKQWIVDNAITRVADPGTLFQYNSTLTMVMGWLLEKVYDQSLAELFANKLFEPMGISSEAHFNTDRFGFPITEGQLSLSLRDFAKAAFAHVNGGKSITGHQIVPQSYIAELSTHNQPLAAVYGRETPMFDSPFYHNHNWCLLPEIGAFTMLGIHGQFAYANPSKQLLIVGQGSYPKQDGALMMSCLKQLWHQIELATN